MTTFEVLLSFLLELGCPASASASCRLAPFPSPTSAPTPLVTIAPRIRPILPSTTALVVVRKKIFPSPEFITVFGKHPHQPRGAVLHPLIHSVCKLIEDRDRCLARETAERVHSALINVAPSQPLRRLLRGFHFRVK